METVDVQSIVSGSSSRHLIHPGGPTKPRLTFLGSVKKAVRIFIAWVFSNVGVCVLVLGYLAVGAFMFKEIEAQEGLGPDIIGRHRNLTILLLWNSTVTHNMLDKQTWTKEVESIIADFQAAIVEAESEGLEDVEANAKVWNYSGAFLYSITVITTIGFGHIVPVTPLGKIMSIFYAVFGVPLFLLYLSNIGNIMARSFKWSYKNLCGCYLAKRIIHRHEAQNVVPYSDNQDYREQDSLSLAFSTDTNSSEKKPTEQVAVPVTLSLAVMVSYLCGGAILFGEWEGWDFLDGFYFCFITLTTIGFGDLLPGDAVDQDDDEEKFGGMNVQFILCSLYILNGMAVIAMTFNLMQERVIKNIRSYGGKLWRNKS